MDKILIVFLFLIISPPVNADTINGFEVLMPDYVRLPFYIVLFVIGLISFISIKNDLKMQSQLQQETKEEEN